MLFLFIIALFTADYFCNICIMISWWYIRPSYISIRRLKKHQLIYTIVRDIWIVSPSGLPVLVLCLRTSSFYIDGTVVWKCHSWLKIGIPVVKYKFTLCALVYLYLFNVGCCAPSVNFIDIFLSILECDWWMFNLNVYSLLSADISFSLQNNTTTNASKMKTKK